MGAAGPNTAEQPGDDHDGSGGRDRQPKGARRGGTEADLYPVVSRWHVHDHEAKRRVRLVVVRRGRHRRGRTVDEGPPAGEEQLVESDGRRRLGRNVRGDPRRAAIDGGERCPAAEHPHRSCFPAGFGIGALVDVHPTADAGRVLGPIHRPW